jgi:hypothetical protein
VVRTSLYLLSCEVTGRPTSSGGWLHLPSPYKLDPRIHMFGSVCIRHGSVCILVDSRSCLRIQENPSHMSQMCVYGFTFRNRVHTDTWPWIRVVPHICMSLCGFVCIRSCGDLGIRMEYVFGRIRMESMHGFSWIRTWAEISVWIRVDSLHYTNSIIYIFMF